jgi:FlaA1/EpsC-like NDP-sugar epimerase
VAFSNGSLLQGFLERLAKRQPLSAPSDVKRYFVAPEESGQLCMIACVLGRNGEIFFPKMEVNTMKTFSEIAEKFLSYFGYEPDYCRSEEEAKLKASKLDSSSTSYPVYFFQSDTSGEKSFEEFYTGEEELDFERFKNLGVIITSEKDRNFDPQILDQFETLFRRVQVSKRDVVELFSNYIDTFEHIETGKNLDQKM